VLGLAFRMLGQYEEAVDLAQEAFLRMWRGIPQFREEASFRTWAFQITLNLARHRRRWYARHRTAKTVSLEAPMSGEEDPEEGGLALAERMADCSPNPRDQVVRRELRATLHGAIARLPVPFRTAVVLRDIQGLPYEEIAAIVGEPIGTVRSRLHRARAMLQAALREVRHEL